MLPRLLPLLLVFALLTPRVDATWSIVLVNVRTGEVCVASATCLENFDLAAGLPVIVVGRGGAAAQSSVDVTGQNRLRIRDEFLKGTDPSQILQLLEQNDPSHQGRQYGIVDVRGRALGFTGSGAGAWAGDRVGQVGDIVYAIQGNVITAGAVLAAAELALFTTPGDMGEKMMAAMEEARRFGGDGRCSCPQGSPTSCGAPPANFRKSADVAFMIHARLGDTDGNCNSSVGCASGSYYMRLNVKNQLRADPDPVLTLRTLFDQWKTTQQGRPDHILSTVESPVDTLPIDGQSTITVRVTLRDRDGQRITRGGMTVKASSDPTGSAQITPGTPRDNGDGTYDIPVTAGTGVGIARLVVTVDDGQGERTLAPYTEFRTVLDRLWVGAPELSVSQGGTLPFALQPGFIVGRNRPWALLASNSGTSPGLRIPPFYLLPLNPDALFTATVVGAFNGVIPELSGVTDAGGLASTALTFPPGAYGLPLGSKVAFAYVLWNPVTYASPAVEVELVR